MLRIVLIFIFSLGFITCSSGSKKETDCKTCKDFTTQAEAKAYSKSHPKCKKKLDSDKDGKFCEDLPKD
jgi:hypothetical protein